MAFKDAKQCKAKSKRSGERCRNPAVVGFEVCRMHGAHGPGSKRPGRKPGCEKPAGSGGPAWRNANALKHGAYSGRLAPGEQAIVDAIQAAFEEDFGGADKLSAADRLLILRLATNAAKLTSAIEKDAPPHAVRPRHRMELELLRELKATRATMDGRPAAGNSPAEVVAALLARVREHAVSVQQQADLQQDTSEGVADEADPRP